MKPASEKPRTPARIESLKVSNFRALREVEFRDLTPLTVLLGPNGSGKSTVFDVFAFLAECFELGLRTGAGGAPWQLVNRIAIEELEAWYFGDWEAVRTAYPRIPSTIPNQQKYRDPDGIAGGTWEAFERVMQQRGCFKEGLRKIEAARALGGLIDAQRSRSPSFRHFQQAVLEAVS